MKIHEVPHEDLLDAIADRGTCPWPSSASRQEILRRLRQGELSRGCHWCKQPVEESRLYHYEPICEKCLPPAPPLKVVHLNSKRDSNND